MSKYRRIKYEDRCQIYALSKRGSSQESIAEVLGVSQSAVSREIHRNRGERGYRFKQAEAKAQARQAIRSKPRKLTVPTRSKIEAKLRQMRWSPEQISGWLSEQGIKLSHERIYQMIWGNKQLACSLSLAGLGDCAAAAIKALRDRLAKGEIQFSGDTAGDVEAMIANLERPEMLTLSKMLTRRAWRIHAIRWLLRVRGAS
jgi:IS30 family transposase